MDANDHSTIDLDYKEYVEGYLSPDENDPILYDLLTDRTFVIFCASLWIFHNAVHDLVGREKTMTSTIEMARQWYQGEPLLEILRTDSKTRVIDICHLLGNHGRFIFRPPDPNGNLSKLLSYGTEEGLSLVDALHYQLEDEDHRSWLVQLGIADQANEVLVRALTVIVSFGSPGKIRLK